jgi:hypothetical protein
MTERRYQVYLNGCLSSDHNSAIASTLAAEILAKINPQDRVSWYDTVTSDIALRQAGRGHSWNLLMYEGAI